MYNGYGRVDSGAAKSAETVQLSPVLQRHAPARPLIRISQLDRGPV
jgi:hypothetical protein